MKKGKNAYLTAKMGQGRGSLGAKRNGQRGAGGGMVRVERGVDLMKASGAQAVGEYDGAFLISIGYGSKDLVLRI